MHVPGVAEGTSVAEIIDDGQDIRAAVIVTERDGQLLVDFPRRAGEGITTSEEAIETD